MDTDWKTVLSQGHGGRTVHVVVKTVLYHVDIAAAISRIRQ